MLPTTCPFLKNGIDEMFMRMQFLIGHNTIEKYLRSNWLVLLAFLLTVSPAFSEDAKLVNLIVRNSNDQLQVDLTINGIFTEKMKMVVSKGMPIRLTFLILLYEVCDYWFDEKIISNLAEVRARRGKVIAVASRGDKTIGDTVDDVIIVPHVRPELQPLLTVIPLQMLAYRIADLRGTDVDQPRNLAKSVTVE